MNNDKKIKTIISSLSGQNNIISFPKVYLILTEDINAALLLNQIVYWSDRTKRKDGFFYKSYKDWTDEIMLTQYQVKRAATKLEQLGFISTKIKKANNAPTNHYRANIQEITNSIMKKLDNKETSQSDYQETSFSDYEETSFSSITDDYKTVDYTVDYSESPHPPDAIESDFEKWWNLYDKKLDKKKVKSIFKRCHKKHGYEAIKKGTEAYLRTVTDKQFQKYPTTFLNAESYLDIEGYQQEAKNMVSTYKANSPSRDTSRQERQIAEMNARLEEDEKTGYTPF
ncbi:hypothetical protein GCM10022378_11340 [Salinicoccus jeotgali]|uniref:Replication protein n=1 Tax=Salinicoccus jeotgali TaxID=381634 RepID=A0ABP7EVV2_9STAP